MELPNAINGCMLFNPDDLRPLFEFQMGSPGSSFTFEVAKNNGIPTKLIKNAKQKLDKEKLKFNELLADLQRKTNRLEQEIQRNKKRASTTTIKLKKLMPTVLNSHRNTRKSTEPCRYKKQNYLLEKRCSNFYRNSKPQEERKTTRS